MTASTWDALVGSWRLDSCIMEDVATGERKLPWGERPNGCLVLTSGGRLIVVQTAEARARPDTDVDKAAAFKSMLAYSGRFRVDANKIVVDVDIAWDESWVCTEQVRYFTVDDDTLRIEAPPQPYPNLGDGLMRAFLVWRRE